MLRTEFHCHTVYSKDSLTTPRQLVEACRRKHIDRVIVTDHDNIAGARAAQAIDPERVIIGEEIMTTRGEILAAFVTEEIPPRLTPAETIHRLRDQGAFISVSHPFDALRSGAWAEPDLLEIAPLVDAIEVFNSRCVSAAYNRQAAAFAQRHNLAGTVGSDAHVPLELGRSVLLLEPYKDADGLRAVIRKATAMTLISPAWFHLFSRYAKVRKQINKWLDASARA
ncbi:MAG: PHP-associated domain-containing protein [Anaerolineae bacterium]